MNTAKATWMAFLAMCFGVVGLTGLFATFATPLPLQRALARDAVLDEVVTAASAGDKAALAALRPRLAESADAVLPEGAQAAAPSDLPARVARERAAMHARFLAEAEEGAVRLRWLTCIVTVMAAVFGCVLLSVGTRTARPDATRPARQQIRR